MKIVFTLLLAVVILFTTAYYFDKQSEQEIYSFCTSYAIGNNVNDLKLAATERNYLMDETGNIILLSNQPLLPLSKISSCEVKIKNNKIEQLHFIKQ